MALLPILFKLPFSLDNLIGVTGEFGSGKTLVMLELALHLCDSYHKHLVVNFPLNYAHIRTYCLSKKYKWFAANGRIIEVDLRVQGITEIFRRKGVVIIFDEGGVLINSRNWAKTGMDFLSPLFQVRHDDNHLIVGFQFQDQVDKQLRDCFQTWVCCRSRRRRDNALRGPRMYTRTVFFYSREKFDKLQNDVRMKANAFRPWLLADYVCYSVLPVKWFFVELHNLFRNIFWYARYFRKPEVLARGLRSLVTSEEMLFKCYKSIGHRIGETDQRLVSHRQSSRPVFVSDGFDAPLSIKVLKPKKDKDSLKGLF